MASSVEQGQFEDAEGGGGGGGAGGGRETGREGESCERGEHPARSEGEARGKQERATVLTWRSVMVGMEGARAAVGRARQGRVRQRAAALVQRVRVAGGGRGSRASGRRHGGRAMHR